MAVDPPSVIASLDSLLNAMKNNLAYLTEKRNVLIARIAEQRVELAQTIGYLRKPLGVAQVAFKGVHYLYKHSRLIFSCIAALLAFRKKNIFFLAFKGWQMLRR